MFIVLCGLMNVKNGLLTASRFSCGKTEYKGVAVCCGAAALSKQSGGKMKLDVIYQKDVSKGLEELPDRSIQCCVTSPPYYGLRDYGMKGQIGIENTPEKYIKKLTEVFREVKRVLCDTGTLWIVIADSYAGSGKGAWKNKSKSKETYIPDPGSTVTRLRTVRGTVKPKDMIGIPWMLAFALRDDGWYLRQDIIWAKPNPMPESVRDRCTKSHEYIFLFSKSRKYYFNADAVKEPIAASSAARLAQDIARQRGSVRVPGKKNGPMKAVIGKGSSRTFRGGGAYTGAKSFHNSTPAARNSHGNVPNESGLRNKRSVWTVATVGYKKAHFATFPPKLIEPCIIAGTPTGGIVLDPFIGTGTTGEVAKKNGRHYIGYELNPEYIELAQDRIFERI